MFTSLPTKGNKSNNEDDGAEARDMQLLKELEALSKALYPSELKSSRNNKTPDHISEKEPQRNHAAAPSPKKYSLFSRKYFSSVHESRSKERKDAYAVQNENKSFPPPLDPKHQSRHSTYMPNQKLGVIKSHLSFSDSNAPSRMSPSWAEGEADIRTRRDRRLSLEDVEIQNVNKSCSPEKLYGFSHRLDSSSESDKSKSVWSWKPLRAISHIGRQKLQCLFSINVREIECLPPAMNGLRLCVHIRKLETKEGAVQTMPTRVFQGIAEFEERLFMKCTLYSNKGHSNTTKFMEKNLIVSVISPDIDGIDFGKHQLDLSKLLAHLMDEKGSSWDTRLDLTGKAMGGKLAIGIGCEVLSKDGGRLGNASSRFIFSSSLGSSSQFSYSLPNSAHATPVPVSVGYSHSVLEQDLETKDILTLDQLNPSALETQETDQSLTLAETVGCELDKGEEPPEEEIEFVVIDQGIETTVLVELSPNEMSIDQGLNIGEKSVDQNRKVALDDADWQAIEEFEEGSVKKENRSLLSREPSAENEADTEKSADPAYEVDEMDADAAGKSISCTLHEIEALETNVHEDDTEKIITVDEGDTKELAHYQSVAECVNSLLQDNRVKEQEHHTFTPEEENTELEPMTDDLKQMIDDSFLIKEASIISALDMDADIGDILKVIELESADGEDLDNEADLVAGEFLKLLECEENPLDRNSDCEPDSPRALLLKQFEEEAIMQGCFGMEFEDPDRMPRLLQNPDSSDVVCPVIEGVKEDNEDFHNVIVTLTKPEFKGEKVQTESAEVTEVESQMAGLGLPEKPTINSSLQPTL